MAVCDPWWDRRIFTNSCFLRCSDNNRASTVLSSFTDAVQVHGLPSRLRTDLGGENVEVWRYMVEQHANSASVITGSSTHNERIERLWRDVHRCVGVVFADTFRELEADGNLDCLNEVDLYCLHFVFLPRINSALNTSLNPGTIIPCRLCTISLLTNYLYVEQLNRIWCLSSHKWRQVLAQVHNQYHQTT